jgi:hypothetical protein
MNPELGDTQEQEKNPESSYQEVMVHSFSEAVVTAVESSYVEREDSNYVALVDIDGAFLEDDRMKIPFFSHRFEPVISDENKYSLLYLVSSFEGSVGIITNRGTKDNPLWNTGKVFSKVKGFLDSQEINIEVYKSLLRQFPFLKMGDTERLIGYLGEKVLESEHGVLDVYAIEDWSIASLNRRAFFNYISKEIEDRYGGVLRVKNYVIKG